MPEVVSWRVEFSYAHVNGEVQIDPFHLIATSGDTVRVPDVKRLRFVDTAVRVGVALHYAPHVRLRLVKLFLVGRSDREDGPINKSSNPFYDVLDFRCSGTVKTLSNHALVGNDHQLVAVVVQATKTLDHA